MPEQVGVYVAPRPLAPTSDHRTIQIKPVLIAAHLDPRRAPTELRLSAPPPPPRRLRYLLPLALLAVALGAVLATQLAGDPEVPEAGQQADPAVAKPAEPAGATAHRPGEAAAALGTSALSAQVAAPASASAAPRKKPRDPWLE